MKPPALHWVRDRDPRIPGQKTVCGRRVVGSLQVTPAFSMDVDVACKRCLRAWRAL